MPSINDYTDHGPEFLNGYASYGRVHIAEIYLHSKDWRAGYRQAFLDAEEMEKHHGPVAHDDVGRDESRNPWAY